MGYHSELAIEIYEDVEERMLQGLIYLDAVTLVAGERNLDVQVVKDLTEDLN